MLGSQMSLILTDLAKSSVVITQNFRADTNIRRDKEKYIQILHTGMAPTLLMLAPASHFILTKEISEENEYVIVGQTVYYAQHALSWNEFVQYELQVNKYMKIFVVILVIAVSNS